MSPIKQTDPLPRTSTLGRGSVFCVLSVECGQRVKALFRAGKRQMLHNAVFGADDKLFGSTFLCRCHNAGGRAHIVGLCHHLGAAFGMHQQAEPKSPARAARVRSDPGARRWRLLPGDSDSRRSRWKAQWKSYPQTAAETPPHPAGTECPFLRSHGHIPGG